MKKEYYKNLMGNLDAAENNGYLEEVLEMSPEEILDDMILECGESWMEPNYDRNEYTEIITEWKRKHADNN